jgi:hypothetical protein
MSDPIYDGDWRLIGYDPELDRSMWMIMEDDGGMHIQVRYGVNAVLAANRQAFNEAPKRFGDWARIASIPFPIYYSSGLDQAIAGEDKKFISKFLNSSDNRAWRTRGGKI